MNNATCSRFPFARWIPLALLLSSVVYAASPAMADSESDAICEADLGPPVTANEASSGALLLETERAGFYVLAPTVRTEVELQVHGMVVRGRVRQTFRNPTAFWVEGKYVFPLPDEAAVDWLRMMIGERVVEGEIQQRQQAQRTYAAAKREGRKASLVEQQRPNVFTALVANMGPGEEIVVEIGYLQTLRWVDGGYRLRFPTVVAPRYGGLVAPEVGAGSAAGHARVVLPCEDVAGNGRLAAGEDGTGELELMVELAAGGPLDSIESSYHEAVIDVEPGFVYRVRLAAAARTDRDFELTWKPRVGANASTRAFVEERDGEFYTLLMIYPPAAEAATELRLSRETVFVIDTSG
ncbi:MAG: VIT domain-containing protein, partial [Acidobacteria bacterium]|nr:VIT domain-containing protein [Acidobacteriota bacterium]